MQTIITSHKIQKVNVTSTDFLNLPASRRSFSSAQTNFCVAERQNDVGAPKAINNMVDK